MVGGVRPDDSRQTTNCVIAVLKRSKSFLYFVFHVEESQLKPETVHSYSADAQEAKLGICVCS